MNSLSKAAILLAMLSVGAFAQTPAPVPAKPAAPARGAVMSRMPAPPPTPAIAPMPPVPPGIPRIPMAWWKDSKMRKELNLNEQQLAKLEQTFTENKLKLIDLRANLEKEETRLQPLLEADRLDENQVSAQLDALVAARGKLEKASAMMGIEMRRVLTQEQWKKLQSLETEMRAPMTVGFEGPRGQHRTMRLPDMPEPPERGVRTSPPDPHED